MTTDAFDDLADEISCADTVEQLEQLRFILPREYPDDPQVETLLAWLEARRHALAVAAHPAGVRRRNPITDDDVAGYTANILAATERRWLVEYMRTVRAFLRGDPRWPGLRAIGAVQLERIEQRDAALARRANSAFGLRN